MGIYGWKGFLIRFYLAYLRPLLEPPVRLLLELEELRVLAPLLEELRLVLDAPVEVPLLRVLLEPLTRLLPEVEVPEGRLLLELPELGRLTLLPLVVGRVEGPLSLELGRLTLLLPVRPLELVPLLGRLTPLLVLVPLGRLRLPLELLLPFELLLPLEGVLPLLVLGAGVGAGGLLPLLWLPPELMLPPLAFGLTVAVGAGVLGAGSLGAGGVTLWVAG